MQNGFKDTLDAALEAALSPLQLRALLLVIIFYDDQRCYADSVGRGRDLLVGKISAGDLSAFVFYAFIVASSTGTLSELGGELQRAAGAADRIAQLLAQPLYVVLIRHTLNSFIRMVGFRYASQRWNLPIIAVFPLRAKGINLTANSGQKLAIVGPSGAGKSTLFHLLLEFYEPQAGQILLNDFPLSQMRLSDIRSHIAIVPQDPVLFSASVAENIAFPRQDASAMRLLPPPDRQKQTALLPNFHKAMKRWLARKVSVFPAASVSVLPLRARFCATLIFCCWMKPPVRWTVLAKRRFRMRLAD